MDDKKKNRTKEEVKPRKSSRLDNGKKKTEPCGHKPESELQRVKRALATIEECHKTLMLAKNKTELMQKICRVMVETGGYDLVWVGTVGKGARKSIDPVAYAGKGETPGCLENMHIGWDDSSRDLDPIGESIRRAKPVVVKNILTAPTMISWRGEALKHGLSSMAALPLSSNGRPFGALIIFSKDTQGFSAAEIKLLKPLAEDLVYGIVALHTREERIKAEKEAKISLEKLKQTFGAIIQVLESTVEIRDPYTAGHQRRVAELARSIAEDMGFSADRVDGIGIAGIIHDIGKICVPAEILSKPSRLSSIEFNLIKTHPQMGYDILKAIEFPWPVAKIVLQHHERLNGSGYPNRLTDGNILMEARILGVADVVEAMASHRPYRPSLGIDEALKEVSRNRGKLYDPDVVDSCLRLFTKGGFQFEKEAEKEFQISTGV